MIQVTREERHWFLRNMAQALVDYTSAVEPPVPVEELLKHPPAAYQEDFGVVDMYSNLWDATFARPPGQRGSIFVRVDLEPKERRHALARETLSAMITSKQGRSMGLAELLMSDLKDSAEYFASQLLAPEPMLQAYRSGGGAEAGFTDAFQLPGPMAASRW
ncbi:MAG TPA: hypothetical protein VI410_02485 [Anaerolineales bacterium]|nr:hypothetical protein [Anaerolineales bacterium]